MSLDQESAGPAAPEATTDAELVAAVVLGDRGAFEAVFDRHGPRLHRQASHLCGPAQAERVVMAVFAGLWSRPRGFEGRHGDLGGLLHQETTLVSVLFPPVDGDRLRAMTDLIRGHRSSDGSALRLFFDDPVADRLMALADDHRDAIALSYFGGHGCCELAALLCCDHATVAHRIRSALDAFAEEGDRSTHATQGSRRPRRFAGSVLRGAR